MLGASLGSVDGVELETTECAELVFWDGKLLDRILASVEGLRLRTYDGKRQDFLKALLTDIEMENLRVKYSETQLDQ